MLIIQNILEVFYLESGYTSSIHYKNVSAMLTEAHCCIPDITKGKLSLAVCNYKGYTHTSLLYELFALYSCSFLSLACRCDAFSANYLKKNYLEIEKNKNLTSP